MNRDFLEEASRVQLPDAALTQTEAQRVLVLARKKAGLAQKDANDANALHTAPPRRKKRRVLRTLLIAAAIACGMMASVYAVTELYKMQQGSVPFYDQGGGAASQYAGLQTQMESYNAAVGQSVEHDGVTLTLDNVAVSGNIISAFFTVRTQEPVDWAQFETIGDGVREPDWLKLQWGSGGLRYTVSTEAGILCESYGTPLDYHAIDDSAFQYMVRMVPSQRLPDTFTLSLEVNGILRKQGSWKYSIPVDITDVARPAVVNAQDIILQTQNGEKTLGLNYLAVSPGGVAAAAKATYTFVPAADPQTQMGDIVPIENAFPLELCMLTDDQGNVLQPLHGADTAGVYPYEDSSAEYIGCAPDAKSITITPAVWREPATPVSDEAYFPTVSVTDIGAKLAASDIGGYIFKDYRVENGTVLIVLEPYGFVGTAMPEAVLEDSGVTLYKKETEVTDGDGTKKMMQVSHSGLMHRMQDYKTGDVTVSITYYAATDEELRAIPSFQYNYTPGWSLDTAAAVTLPLSR